MYERILIPTDGSKDAQKGIDHGIDLAASLGATVHALYVVKEGANPWETESMESQTERAREYGREVTGKVAERAADRGVECVQAVKVGPAVHEKINDYAEEEGIDVVVMGSGYKGAIGGMLGSTAEKVLRSSSVPVTILRWQDTE